MATGVPRDLAALCAQRRLTGGLDVPRFRVFHSLRGCRVFLADAPPKAPAFWMLNKLSARFLMLTVAFVMLAEVLLFVPSLAEFRKTYLQERLERAQLASLALIASDALNDEIEAELLQNTGVFNVVLHRDSARVLMLAAPVPGAIDATYDLRTQGLYLLVRDALRRLFDPTERIIRVVGAPKHNAQSLIEITMPTSDLRQAMIDFGVNILLLSLAISAFTALLLFVVVQAMLVAPIKDLIGYMKAYAAAPEDARRIIMPRLRVRELREAQEALKGLQLEITMLLRQEKRLAQLGGAVARVSHDLRNILTTAQLFTHRLRLSNDPAVKRLAPKLVGSIQRAVSLCESTLAFGKAEEPPPRLAYISLAALVADVFENEELATPKQEVQFRADIDPMLRVRADAEQLFRVLTNLVSNARQAIMASGQGGEIVISAQIAQNDWVIVVRDTGPGLPAKAQEHLFTPFQGRGRKGGTGLGLAIAQELIKGHGGTLALKDSGPEGTCFEIRLPMGVVAP